MCGVSCKRYIISNYYKIPVFWSSKITFMLLPPKNNFFFSFWTDIKPKEDFYNWYDAQDHCLGRGLTLEKDKSGQPYWTGEYRRRTPWINILGQYQFILVLSSVNITIQYYLYCSMSLWVLFNQLHHWKSSHA